MTSPQPIVLCVECLSGDLGFKRTATTFVSGRSVCDTHALSGSTNDDLRHVLHAQQEFL